MASIRPLRTGNVAFSIAGRPVPSVMRAPLNDAQVLDFGQLDIEPPGNRDAG
jgi:hypothetical protein